MAERTKSGPDRITDLLKYQPFPELAAALRSQSTAIIERWVEQVRLALPSVRHLTFEELRDGQPAILARMADALASASAEDAERLAEQSPSQGITRFRQRYDVRELVLEDRLLRRIIIEHVQGAMDRRMTLAEQVALDMAIDVMLQQAVVAFVGEQHSQLRVAAEAELKYLSFLSHDLNNNLSTVTLFLKLLRRRLESSPAFAADVRTLDDAQQAVTNTIGGMARLLESERLRKASVPVERRPVNLHGVLATAVRQSSEAAEKKGIKIAVDALPDVVAETDRELIGLVVQNFVGNAVKYSSKGTVRVGAAWAGGRCVLSVTDEGPGIAVEHLSRIFDAFARGEMHGQGGVGLGLAIASQAAKLLGAELTVESKVGVGSTFRLALPPTAPG